MNAAGERVRESRERKMPTYNPALVIIAGDSAGKILGQVRRLICKRCHVESVPEIFQLITQPAVPGGDAIRQAYAAALSSRAIEQAEAALRAKVDTTRVETFIIAPLQNEHYTAAVEISNELKRCGLHMVSGWINALFLIARNLLALDSQELQTAAQRLDVDMKTKGTFPFNRCFFIDEVNESGRVVNDEDDFIYLVAHFIALAVASELAQPLINNPPPYIGDGESHTAYASFCCQTVRFNRGDLIDLLACYLARDLSQYLFSSVNVYVKDSATWSKDVNWFEHGLRQALSIPSNRVAGEVQTGETGKAGKDGVAQGAAVKMPPDGHRQLDTLSAHTLTDLKKLVDSISEQCGDNMKSCREFFEECLSRGLASLENFAEELEKCKERIADLQIKIMLGIKPEEKLLKRRRILRKPCLFREKITIEKYTVPVPVSWDKQLKKEQEQYARREKFLEVYVEVFQHLDLICACLDMLREMLHNPPRRGTAGMFELNLIDEEIAHSLYTSGAYGEKDGLIDDLMRSNFAGEFKESLFLYPNSHPYSLIRHRSQQQFTFVNDHAIETICRQRNEITGKKVHLFSPFWRPPTSAFGQRLQLISAAPGLQTDLDNFFDHWSTSTSPIYCQSRYPELVTVVQISYGLPIHHCVAAPHESPQQGEAASGTEEVRQQL